MKIQVLIILFFVFLSCENVTKKEVEEVQKAEDSTGLKIAKAEKQVKNSNLISFLENPIDFQAFKELKDINYTTTGVANGRSYYFQPNIKDSIFYAYNYPTENIKDFKRIDYAIVFKYGENKHAYDDTTEILIELRIYNKDPDLGKANLVGLTRTELEAEFGTDYLTIGKRIVFSNSNKVLILEIENSEVISFQYIKLDTEKIDNDLIGRITM